MKIQSLLAAVVLPAVLLLSVSNAQAQRKNTTSHDVQPVMLNQQAENSVASQNDNAPADGKNMYKKHQKDKKKMMDKCACKDCKKGADCNCGKDGGCMNTKMMKKQHHEAKEDVEGINEDYMKAIKKIQESTFNDEQKVLLTQQAEHNKDLALKQLQERQTLRQKHMQERMNLGMQELMKGNKTNRKAVKKVDKIDWD